MPKTMIDLETYRQPAMRAVDEIFQTMLESEARPLTGKPADPPAHPIVGAVYLTGEWKGALLLETEAQQAFAWTAKLMSIEPPSDFDDDVRDTMGELTSMISGNLKPLLPVQTALSIPSVVEGRQFTLRLIGEHQKIRLDFDSPEGPFSLTMVQLTED